MGILRFSMVVAAISGLVGVIGIGECAQAETLTVGAAYSLKAPFEEIVPLFEKEYGATVEVVYGPSQTLRQQIEKGTPIDVFLPESVDEVEKLQKQGLTLGGRGPQIFAQTSPVLVTATSSTAISVAFRDALPNRAIRIALVDPRMSALGGVTASALMKIDPAYRTRAQLLRVKHSDEVVNLIRTGQADVGIVYRADAINSAEVRIIDEAPTGRHMPIQFGQAVVWTCRNSSQNIAEGFLDFMMSPRVQKLLLKYGFDPVTSKG